VSRTLITGMSAVGKSSTISQLMARGHHAVDLDTDEWSQLVPDDSAYADPATDDALDWRWREDEVRMLLTADHEMLFVAGTSTHQSRLYPLLDHVVLLTIPTDVAVERLANRATNQYGKDATELQREVYLRTIVEPQMRRSACLVIDTSVYSLAVVATIIVSHAGGKECSKRGRRRG
jgi:shikimate kinase